jgi:hypothetical protein
MRKSRIPKKFRLPFSVGIDWITEFLHKRSKKLLRSEAFLVSKKLYQKITEHNAVILKEGLPSHLHLAYVHPKVKTGVFLKMGEKPIKMGSFIGIYTGLYELVPGDLGTNTSYAYDVAAEIRIPKSALQYIQYAQKKADTKEEYAIQTNAYPTGNFTRFINHSSLEPNIEAIVSKLPEGRIEIILFALKEIKPGEQLLSNYGGQYWTALNVIPNDMTPTTYRLNKLGKVELVHKHKAQSKKVYEALLSLRNPFLEIPKKLTPIASKLKKALPKLSRADKKHVEEFEEIILEKGLPRHLEWKSISSHLRLKKESKAISKNGFIGVLAGTLTTNPSDLFLGNFQGKSLWIHSKEKANRFNLLSKSAKGNVRIELTYDSDRETLLPLLIATKKIHPGDALLLQLS